jgi:hypothetical protein
MVRRSSQNTTGKIAVIDAVDIIKSLAIPRPLYHSEADFQHAFAWEFHRQLPNAAVRLELPLATSDQVLHLDFWATSKDESIAVELKYKTRALSVQLAGERFDLANHSAQDLGRYDFIKDIQRLEQVKLHRENVIGYAILITNDSSYWKRSGNRHTIDADFRLEQGRVLHGVLKWGEKASAGTKRGREEPIVVRGQYELSWEDYSQPSSASYGVFRYLAVKVE